MEGDFLNIDAGSMSLLEGEAKDVNEPQMYMNVLMNHSQGLSFTGLVEKVNFPSINGAWRDGSLKTMQSTAANLSDS